MYHASRVNVVILSSSWHHAALKGRWVLGLIQPSAAMPYHKLGTLGMTNGVVSYVRFWETREGPHDFKTVAFWMPMQIHKYRPPPIFKTFYQYPMPSSQLIYSQLHLPESQLISSASPTLLPAKSLAAIQTSICSSSTEPLPSCAWLLHTLLLLRSLLWVS